MYIAGGGQFFYIQDTQKTLHKRNAQRLRILGGSNSQLS